MLKAFALRDPLAWRNNRQTAVVPDSAFNEAVLPVLVETNFRRRQSKDRNDLPKPARHDLGLREPAAYRKRGEAIGPSRGCDAVAGNGSLRCNLIDAGERSRADQPDSAQGARACPYGDVTTIRPFMLGWNRQ